MSCVLITGATGFVGGALSWELLHDARVDRLVFLVRGRSDPHARERLVASLRRFGELPPRERPFEIVRGDLADIALDRTLADAVTHVVHAAACTSFRARREAWRTNVEGTRRLAEAVRAGRRLQRFLFVGSAYACGAATTTVVHEDDPPSDTHVAEYTRTKQEAERVVDRMDGLPVLAARPSIVVGHTRLGVAPSASLFWYYQALAAAGVSPFPDEMRRDIVSVDYVAGALVHLLFHEHPRFRRYHVSAGAGAAVTWGALRAALGGGPSTFVPNEALADHSAWRHHGADARFRRALAACARFAALPVEIFANERLLAEGVPVPPPFTTWAAKCRATAEADVAASSIVDD